MIFINLNRRESASAHSELAALGAEHDIFHNVCVRARRPILASTEVWEICRATFNKLDQWTILAAVAMPDHLHILATPNDRADSVSQFAKWFKRWFNDAYRSCTPSVADRETSKWNWQEGCFDRLLRSDESLKAKWEYIRQNPVRANLVKNPDDWPYQFQFDGSQW